MINGKFGLQTAKTTIPGGWVGGWGFLSPAELTAAETGLSLAIVLFKAKGLKLQGC